MTVLFTNNATSRLASAITSGATTLTVTTGEGSKYPSPATSVEWFPLTLIKDTGALEIVRCTARAGDVMTIRRAEESTTAEAFAIGDRVELRMTAAALTEFQQGGQLFMPFWWPNRAAIPAGMVAADGQLLSRATYPDAAAGVLAGNVPTVADATWLSTPLQRGRYTVGDGSTTFRMPDYNGKYAGSLGALFLRGDGALSAGTDGDIQLDAMQNLTGKLQFRNCSGSNGADVFPTAGTGFMQYDGQVGNTYANQNTAITNSTPNGVISLDASRSVRTATEERPLNVTGCWVIKLFGMITNPGSANAAQLASDLANLNTDIQSSDSYIGGLIPVWNSSTSITVGVGDAYIPGLARKLRNPSPLTLSGLSLTSNTWYYLYLYNNAGAAAIELVTTAPDAAYSGTARTKTGDTSRRFIAALKSNTGVGVITFQWMNNGFIQYCESTNTAPFRVAATATATTATTVSLAAVVPMTTRTAELIVTLAPGSSAFDMFLTTPDFVGKILRYFSSIVGYLVRVNVDMQTDASQRISYLLSTSVGGGGTIDVYGYGSDR